MTDTAGQVSDETLAELRRLAAEATPGPWDAHPATSGTPSDGPTMMRVDSRDLPGRPIIADFDYSQGGGADAAYIAAADPPTVLALLDTVDTLRAERDAARERLARVEALAREIEGGRTPWAYRLRAALADTAKEATKHE